MQRLPTKMQRRPPSPHQATLARITAEGRKQRELQALDHRAKRMGMPARQDGEGERAYLARLGRHMRSGQGMPEQENGAS
jgi:hypothetical protein